MPAADAEKTILKIGQVSGAGGTLFLDVDELRALGPSGFAYVPVVSF